jgi:hypothetical protein
MTKMTTKEEGKGRSSGKGLETRLQAEGNEEPWRRTTQFFLPHRRTAETEPAINQIDETSPADTPHAPSAGDYYEDSILNEVSEGVWGYLRPLNSQYSTPIGLKNAKTSLIAKTEGSYETENLQHADRNPVSSAGRYLIGRHPECGE